MALEGYIVYEATVKYRALKRDSLYVVEISQDGEKWVEKVKYPTIEEAKDYINEISKSN